MSDERCETCGQVLPPDRPCEGCGKSLREDKRGRRARYCEDCATQRRRDYQRKYQRVYQRQRRAESDDG